MVRALFFALVLSACAAPVAGNNGSVARLAEGGPIAPPDGVMEYCARAPGECGAMLSSDLRGLSAPTGGAQFQPASYAQGQVSLFHALMAQRSSAQADAALLGPRAEAVLTEARRAELVRINRQINRAIIASTDEATYGADEYWVRPIAVAARGRARGDCEDFALEKRAALLALGWRPETLAMAIAVSPRVGLHAVLVVQTNEGDLVLDNLYDRPRAIGSLDYTWVSRQTGPSLGQWTSARLSGAPSPAAPRGGQGLAASDAFHRMLEERARRHTQDAAAPVAPPAPVPALLAPIPQPVAFTLYAPVRQPKPVRRLAKPEAMAVSARLAGLQEAR